MTARKARKAAKRAPATGSRAVVNKGRALAEEVLEFRRTQQKKRAKAMKQLDADATPARARLTARGRGAARTSIWDAFGGATSAGTLIAEGDSWFDYPFHDVLRLLEDEHAYDVESVAHKGDRVEDMAFSAGQLEEFSRRLEKLLRDGKAPRAILLSGGGNDIAGDAFGMLLNHARSPIAGVNEDILRGVVDQRVNTAYRFIISALTAVCQEYLGKPLPILTHGYDYPVPDGRGFLGGWGPLPGPWLEPGFREKGYADRAVNIRTMRMIIDRFNEMLKSVADAFPHVTYINLRGTLSAASNYKTYWANELHPTERGFRLVADKFAKAVGALP